MRYLARALGPGASRYVLTHHPDGADWQALGLHAVGYPVANGSHAALADAINGWATQASMGLLEHRQRIGQLVSSAPSQIPEEASYLEAVLADPSRVSLLLDLARGNEWLTWASTRPQFRKLFDVTAEPSETTRKLAYWYAENFVVNEHLTSAALGVMREAGGRLAAVTWSAIGHHLHMAPSPRPEWLSPWIVQLIEEAPKGSSEWLEYALTSSRLPEDRTVVILLFDHLTEPHVRPESLLGVPGKTKFSIELYGSDHWLDQAWRELIKPNLGELAVSILATADRHIRRAWNLLLAADSAGEGWDPISFSRSAIEPHPEDKHRKPIDSLIDAARDSLEVLLESRHVQGIAYLNTWAESNISILQRLALHGWSQRTDVDSSTKIRWLREQNWLYSHQLRHEVFQLIANNLGDAGTPEADDLVADLATGPDDDDEQRQAYAKFNALTWATRHAPSLNSAASALEEIRRRHPEFAEREDPDLTSKMTVGFFQPQSPTTVEELHSKIETDTTAAVAELRRYEGTRLHFDGPTWEGALSTLRETVRDYPEDGFKILDVVAEGQRDLTSAVVTGWSAASVSDKLADAILQRLTGINLTESSESVSRMLSAGSENDLTPTEWHRYAKAKELAKTLWQAVEYTPLEETADWLGKAINATPGRLALFWVNNIAAEWRAAGDAWEGLSDESKNQIELMISSEDSRASLAETVFASQLLFFFGADRAWCIEHLLPLFDWTKPERSRRAWDGYLVWGRWNDHLLEAGLHRSYLAAAQHAAEFREELQRQLCSHLAAIALVSDREALDWIREFTASTDVSVRVEWMNQVTWMLDELPPEAVEHQWQRWMHPYWQGRLSSIPRQLDTKEASAMSPWVLFLSSSLAEGISLAVTRPAGIAEHSSTLRKLNADRLDSSPAQFGSLVAHLMKSTEAPFWECSNLKKIVEQLRGKASTQDINTIIAEALRLGCTNAAQW